MNSKETIRDFYGKILGYIETDAQGNKTVRDFYSKILGRYSKIDNTTRDFYNKIIARGDQAASLIYRK